MLSTTSQYALRALTFIAAHEGVEAVLGRRIAEKTGIPSNYLSKLLIELNNAGLVSASRGTGGGYRLAAPPSSITLNQVVGVFDPDVVNPCCLLGHSHLCSDETACSAHSVWKKTRAALTTFLNSTTLADIAGLKHARPKKKSQPKPKKKRSAAKPARQSGGRAR
ncbi:MAG: Rrf2 family transcriptional regulator [Bryobacterales bacterium]|nr:Rrf2 family transcriptional regulator [Bryobacterales bacterium]